MVPDFATGQEVCLKINVQEDFLDDQKCHFESKYYALCSMPPVI